jgi:hypothetical protein
MKRPAAAPVAGGDIDFEHEAFDVEDTAGVTVTIKFVTCLFKHPTINMV